MIVDFCFYSTVYMGSEADAASFPALLARAEDIVSAMTRYAVNEANINTLPPLVQTLYKKAICAQIDFLAINGAESVTAGGDGGFTVGKVTVHGKNSSGETGRMSGNISPLVTQYMEQTGLMNPQVPTLDRWW